MLLDLLARQKSSRHARELATVITGLAVTAEERDQGGETMSERGTAISRTDR